MRQSVIKRLIGLATLAAIVAIAACSDSMGTGPEHTGLQTRTAGAGNDSSGSAGGTGTGGTTSDTAVRHDTADTRHPVASFRLDVHVGTPTPGAADTLATDPVPGIVVTVSTLTRVRSSGVGDDTLTVKQTLVASAKTDAQGNVSFPKLDGSAGYLIQAETLPGTFAGSVFIDRVLTDPVEVNLVIRKQ